MGTESERQGKKFAGGRCRDLAIILLRMHLDPGSGHSRQLFAPDKCAEPTGAFSVRLANPAPSTHPRDPSLIPSHGRGRHQSQRVVNRQRGNAEVAIFAEAARRNVASRQPRRAHLAAMRAKCRALFFSVRVHWNPQKRKSHETKRCFRRRKSRRPSR